MLQITKNALHLLVRGAAHAGVFFETPAPVIVRIDRTTKQRLYVARCGVHP
jgi:hypothetical protein